jgi:hypothetical protein
LEESLINTFTFEQFVGYFEKFGRFPDNSYVSKKGYNIQQLRTKFKRFLSSQGKFQEKKKKQNEKQIEKNIERAKKVDLLWEKVKTEVDLRDGHSCRLFRLLSVEEKKLIKDNLFGKMKTTDRAHVFRRSKYPHIKYFSDNVVCLYRLFHSRLDSYTNPLTGQPITSEEVNQWWKRIIGEDLYSKLEFIANKTTPIDKAGIF